MTTLREQYCAAQTFDAFLAGTETNKGLWQAIARRARAPDDLATRVEAMGDKWHLLVIAENAWSEDVAA